MSSRNLSRLDGNARWQATVIATNKYMLMRQVLQLIRCMCGSNNVESTSKCSCRCSCNRNSLVCTELCNCAEDDKCQNTEPMLIALDTKDGHACTCERRVCSNQTLWVVGSLSNPWSGFSGLTICHHRVLYWDTWSCLGQNTVSTIIPLSLHSWIRLSVLAYFTKFSTKVLSHFLFSQNLGLTLTNCRATVELQPCRLC